VSFYFFDCKKKKKKKKMERKAKSEARAVRGCGTHECNPYCAEVAYFL